MPRGEIGLTGILCTPNRIVWSKGADGGQYIQGRCADWRPFSTRRFNSIEVVKLHFSTVRYAELHSTQVI
jgi:hypothetical protein